MSKNIFLISLLLIFYSINLFSQAQVQFSAETLNNSTVNFRNNGSTSNNGSQFLLGHNNTGFAAYYLDASDGDFIGLDYSLLKQNDDLSLELVNLGSNPIYFKTNGDDLSHTRLSISGSGNIGVGNSFASSKLQVTGGDVYIEDINKGVIMRSQDGNCWRLTVDNSGNIVTSTIACP